MTASAPELGFKSYSRFVAMVCIAHLFTYIVAGTLAYQLIYKSAIDLGCSLIVHRFPTIRIGKYDPEYAAALFSVLVHEGCPVEFAQFP